MGIGNISEIHVTQARQNLAEAFDVQPATINFSAAGEMGMMASLPYVEGFGDKNREVERAVKKATGAMNVKPDYTPEGRIKGLLIEQADFEGAMRSVSGMGRQELDDLKTSLAAMKEPARGRKI